jgi:hypothetical protein
MSASQDNYTVGKLAKTTVNGTDINGNGWSVDPTADDVDVTGTRSAGYGACITGVRRATFTMTLIWDALANPLDNPPNLKAGSTITNTKLYLNGLTSPFWSFPFAKVIGTPMEAKVGDALAITVNCKSDGAFAEPTGNFTPAA